MDTRHTTENDIYSRVTRQIVEALENTTPWTRPWAIATGLPVNVWTQKPYRGANVLALWAEAATKGYGSPLWGTFRQWKHFGASVRRGEKASFVVFWNFAEKSGEAEVGAPGDDDAQDVRRVVLARGYPVFNAAQVEGYNVAAADPQVRPCWDSAASAFVAAQEADVRHGGNAAYYHAGDDFIRMPDRECFRDEASYFSVLAHELAHWTGAPSRLARDLSGRFGSDAYAMEELIAELGAAFVCATLGVSLDPRLDHANYVASWLDVFRRDTRAVFTAASTAQEAADWMQARNARHQAAA